MSKQAGPQNSTLGIAAQTLPLDSGTPVSPARVTATDVQPAPQPPKITSIAASAEQVHQALHSPSPLDTFWDEYEDYAEEVEDLV